MTVKRKKSDMRPYSIKLIPLLLYLIVFCLGLLFLLRLGVWQWSRFETKKARWAEWTHVSQQVPEALDIILSKDPNTLISGQPVQVGADWICRSQPLFVANQVEEGQHGYRPIWIVERQIDPQVSVALIGHFLTQPHLHPVCALGPKEQFWLVKPQAHFHLQSSPYRDLSLSPFVLEWMDLKAVSEVLKKPLASFWLSTVKPYGEKGLSPEKHLNYALQWFLFAGLWLGYGIYFGRQVWKSKYRKAIV